MFIGWCYALADVIAIYVVVDGKPQGRCHCLYSIKWQMFLPYVYVSGGRPLDWMLQHLKMADVIAKWQMEQLLCTVYDEHINSIDHHIQFTSEDSTPDGSMPFLDMKISSKEDGRFSTTVYRKPTHTDLYLQWNSHHTISSKYSVVGTLHHRAKTICSSPQLLQQEEDHLYRV